MDFSGKLKTLKALSVSHSHSNLDKALQFLDSSSLLQEETNYLEVIIWEAGFKTSHQLHPGLDNYQQHSSVKTRLTCKQRPSARHNPTIRGFLHSQALLGLSNSKLSHSSSFKGSLHSLGLIRSRHLDSLEPPSPATNLVNLNNNSNNNPRCSKLNLNLANLAWLHSQHKDLLASPCLHLLLHLEEGNQEGSLGIKWAKILNHKVSLQLRL